MKSTIKIYECVSCYNTWSISEGYNLKTKQCKGCQDYDNNKETRKNIELERQNYLQLHKVDFEYSPGDPFW